MKLYHVTHRSNRASILLRGLDPKKARGRRKSVWGVVKSRVEWAIVHILVKPWNVGCTVPDLVVIEFSLPRAKVARYKTGIWYTKAGGSRVKVDESQIKQANEYGKVK